MLYVREIYYINNMVNLHKQLNMFKNIIPGLDSDHMVKHPNDHREDHLLSFAANDRSLLFSHEISHFNHNGSSGRLYCEGWWRLRHDSGNEKHGVKPWRGGEPPSVDRSISSFVALGGCSKATGGAVPSEPADGMIR